ncbi:MAG: DUF1501 domain-containing protein [Isosphaeraceae bacterium]
MLTVFGPRSSGYCDGVSRRGFLRIGTFAMGGAILNLADVLRAESVSNSNSTSRTRPGSSSRTGGKLGHKAIINVYLAGGPPHQDMFDLKPDAPAEIRGEFKPIATNVPGIDICEVFPGLARHMDKAAIIRSIVGATGRHDLYQCNTGWSSSDLQVLGGRPSIGAVATRVLGPVDPAVPPFVGLAAPTQHLEWSDPGATGFLGRTFAPFKPSGPDIQNMTLQGMSVDRFDDRKRLLSSFDKLRRDVDASGVIEGADAATSLAFDVLTSSKLVEALDLSREDPRLREKYGDGKPYKYQYDGAPTVNDQLLVARRLVEAGVRVVSLSYGRWDSHGQNFALVRDHGSKLDQCLTALIEDLEARGLLDDVTVIVWGEFGRTPRINKDAGRDHWPQVNCAWLAGGGIKGGQIVGATNRLGESVKDRPVTFGEVLATLYHNIGIDVGSVTVRDPAGRPQYPVETRPMRELV